MFAHFELSKNKKAFFDYEVLDKLEAGIILLGFEAKSIKKGKMNLAGSYVIIKNNEAFLLNADIPPYQVSNTPLGYDQKRTRKLLLRKQEIKQLFNKSKEKGLTLVPLTIYNKNGLIKVEIAIAKGKKTFDKREKIKKREIQTKISRALKGEY